MKDKGNKTKQIAVLLCFLLLMSCIGGCNSDKREKKKEEAQEVKIPMILTVDPSSGKKNEQKVIDAFNQAYDGIYEVDVEWIMETEDEYRQNLKRLNATDELPAVITDIRMLPSFYQMMIADGRIEDLSGYINEDTKWKNMIEPVVLNGCMEEDGSVYLAPLSTAVFSCSGIFYNEELFMQAGIQSFPNTWEEFWDCCKKLEEQGITPLALHTDGTAWAPMLLATAELSTDEEGEAFMKELYPKSYQNKSGLRLADTLKRLFGYTTNDALYADFDAAYNNFFRGEAAMLPNGYWMIDQIPQSMTDKVRFAAFPENKLISSPETFGWALVSDYSDEVKEGAVAFFRFRTEMNQKEKEEFLAKKAWEVSPAEADYINAYLNQPEFVPNYQVKWNSILQEQMLDEYLPQLVTNQMTAEEFTEMADESVRQFEAEQ